MLALDLHLAFHKQQSSIVITSPHYANQAKSPVLFNYSYHRTDIISSLKGERKLKDPTFIIMIQKHKMLLASDYNVRLPSSGFVVQGNSVKN
jgi:hypothetical protein